LSNAAVSLGVSDVANLASAIGTAFACANAALSAVFWNGTDGNEGLDGGADFPDVDDTALLSWGILVAGGGFFNVVANAAAAAAEDDGGDDGDNDVVNAAAAAASVVVVVVVIAATLDAAAAAAGAAAADVCVSAIGGAGGAYGSEADGSRPWSGSVVCDSAVDERQDKTVSDTRIESMQSKTDKTNET
jgi:hypothetical protein